jgi:hypothetical protein
VKLTASSTLITVALAVGSALHRNGIRAVLTGGACVSLYTRGAFHSKDVDFVLSTSMTQADLDTAMESVGFTRRGDRYEHPDTPFYVEFPPGPLAIGGDLDVRPVEVRRSRLRTLALSATDCCRDRLAAFYHWNDRQSLRAAVLVAVRNRIRMNAVGEWSRDEGATDRFEEFRAEVRRARRERAKTTRSG